MNDNSTSPSPSKTNGAILKEIDNKIKTQRIENLNFQDAKSSLNSTNLQNLKATNNTKFLNSKGKNLDTKQAEINPNDSKISKRDYDREPLVIKDFQPFILFSYFAIVLVISSFCLKILYENGTLSTNYLSRTYRFYMLDGVFYTQNLITFILGIFCYKIGKLDNVIFNNSIIKYTSYIKTKENLEISSIKKNYLKNINKGNKDKSYIFWFMLLIASVFFVAFNKYDFAITAIGIVIMRFVPLILFSIHQNKNFSEFGCLSVLMIENKKTIFLLSKKDKDEIIKYFLEKLEIDITSKIIYLLPR